MKYFKYSGLVLLWLLIKPLAFAISFLIFKLWSYLLDLNVWWGYLLAFLPTIIIYVTTTIIWTINKFNCKTSYYDPGEERTNLMFLLLAAIPPVLIGISLVGFSFGIMEFPNKHDLERLGKKC